MNMWKQFVSTMNASIGGNSFIDLYAEKGDPRSKLVIFGLNPEERACKFHLVDYYSLSSVVLTLLSSHSFSNSEARREQPARIGKAYHRRYGQRGKCQGIIDVVEEGGRCIEEAATRIELRGNHTRLGRRNRYPPERH